MSQNVINFYKSNNKNAQKAENAMKPSTKRPATSPAKGAVHKRSAFGDLTNAVNKQTKKIGTKAKSKPQTKQESKRKSIRIFNQQKEEIALKEDSSESEDSLSSSQGSNSGNSTNSKDSTSSPVEPEETCFYEHKASPKRQALKYEDLDLANINNPNETPEYGFVIFEYMRSRESMFKIESDFLSKYQTELTQEMRAILVDWMVEVQENFELNHETLYLAVKLVDHYLHNVVVGREKLQLLGATCLLIAAKFDERHPPFVDDFLYICDDAYKRKELLAMERSVLKQVGYDINIPISYRFLRRYAKCVKSSMEILTLGRFILELSLQSYNFVAKSASKMAAAALWLALKMKKSDQKWNDTLLYYTTHAENEVFELACELNEMVNESNNKKLKTIYQKYSHTIFYEVAKTATLSPADVSKQSARINACVPNGGVKNYLEL